MSVFFLLSYQKGKVVHRIENGTQNKREWKRVDWHKWNQKKKTKLSLLKTKETTVVITYTATREISLNTSDLILDKLLFRRYLEKKQHDYGAKSDCVFLSRYISIILY